MEHYDLVVIGSGPAGEKGAEQAAEYGKTVALIEQAEHLGGAGINTGTIPSKTLRETALYFSGLQQRGLYGIDYSLRAGLSVREFMHREHVVVGHERRQIEENVARHKMAWIHGKASFIDAHTVHVRGPRGEQDVSGDIILVATGSSPFHPADIPFDHRLICDSDSLLQFKRIPKTMGVMGGGVVGIEYASIFAALGVHVTLFEARSRILPFVDSEIVEHLTHQLEGLGLKFMLNTRLSSINCAARNVTFTSESGEAHVFELMLIAAGRQSNVEGLGLDQIGVKLGERGLVLVNGNFQTNVANVYAAGDVIGFPALAATSMDQARAAMTHAFGQGYEARISPILPLAVYAVPEISMVGLTEDECKTRNIAYLVGRASYADNARGQIIGDLNGMLKLIFAPADRKLLGAHVIGEQAAELIHLAAHAMTAEAGLEEFIHAVYNYPTLTDLYKAAAYDGLDQLEHWKATQVRTG
jgi:NAD(P) transhydrogenase